MPKAAPSAFVEWFKAEIDSRGWGIRETARRLNVSHPVISSIITHGESPSWDTCAAIAKAFDLPADYVLRLAGLLPKQPDETPEFKEWIGLIDGLPAEAVREMIAVARALRAEKQKTKRK